MVPWPRADTASELTLRLLSGAVLIALALAAGMAGGWAFRGLVLAFALGVAWEWFALARVPGRWAALAALGAMWLALSWHDSVEWALYAALVGALGTAVAALVRRGGPGGAGWAAAGTVYAALPLTALPWLREEAGAPPLLWLFVVVWASDAAAYACGRILGGPKLAPSVSPAKTWSGAAGGLLCALLCGTALAPRLLDVSAARGAWLAGAIAVAAQLGDLLESRVKRRFGAARSGDVIPGHGGFMDRCDSLAVAAPVFAALVLAGAPAAADG